MLHKENYHMYLYLGHLADAIVQSENHTFYTHIDTQLVRSSTGQVSCSVNQGSPKPMEDFSIPKGSKVKRGPCRNSGVCI